MMEVGFVKPGDSCWWRRSSGAIPAIFLCLNLLCVAAQHEESLDAFVPAAHKTAFEGHSLLALGAVDLAKSAVAGRLAASGKVQLEEFEVNKDAKCNKYLPAITTAGSLTASMGAINNGFIIAGRYSRIKHNVRMSCSSRVEAYDPTRQKIRSFDEHRTALIRETGDVCVNPRSGSVEVDTATGVMRLVPGNSTYSCYSVFATTTSDLASVNRLEYNGTDHNRNVLLLVSGKYATLRDFAMVGFNPVRTLITFCSVYGRIELFNARLHASVFAPTTDFTMMGTIVNGSMITASIRGKVAILQQDYFTC